MLNQFAMQIAEIVLAISSKQPIDAICFEDSYQDFLSSEEPDVTLHASYDGLPLVQLRDEDKIFDSELVWSLYRIDGQNVFTLRSPPSSPSPYRIAILDTDFRHGHVYTIPRNSTETTDCLLPNPLEFPLGEVLMVCLLAQGRGLMVHACGIDDGGHGYLFTGNSTHGKSTLARIWKDHAVILNDDRIVLRLDEGRFWMYGTPWHGDYTGISPNGVPLEKLFFLNQASYNSVSQKQGVAAASMLLTHAFPPLWDEVGMRFSLDFSARLTENVSCYSLDFVPDNNIVDFVRCVR